jgi:hypothetical protein
MRFGVGAVAVGDYLYSRVPRHMISITVPSASVARARSALLVSSSLGTVILSI